MKPGRGPTEDELDDLMETDADVMPVDSYFEYHGDHGDDEDERDVT